MSLVVARSHQPFRPVRAVKLLGIMLRNRCWPATFLTIRAGDADGWCLNWLVWSAPHAVITSNCPSGWSCEIVGDYVGNLHCYKLRCWWMVSGLAGVISPSCLDHTKLPVRFEPCNRWGLCWEIYNVTNGDSDGWCQQWLVWSTPHSLISWNPGERMFVGQISLLVASLSPPYIMDCVIMQTGKEVNPHPRIAPCVNMWSVFLFFFFINFWDLLHCWCMDLPRCSGKPSGMRV